MTTRVLQRRDVSRDNNHPKEGWESKIAQALKMLGWEYKYEPVCFEYVNMSGDLRGFCPDFQINDDLYIEITEARNFHSHRSKVRATMRHHPGIRIILLEPVDFARFGESADSWRELPRIMEDAYQRFIGNAQPELESDVA